MCLLPAPLVAVLYRRWSFRNKLARSLVSALKEALRSQGVTHLTMTMRESSYQRYMQAHACIICTCTCTHTVMSHLWTLAIICCLQKPKRVGVSNSIVLASFGQSLLASWKKWFTSVLSRRRDSCYSVKLVRTPQWLPYLPNNNHGQRNSQSEVLCQSIGYYFFSLTFLLVCIPGIVLLHWE